MSLSHLLDDEADLGNLMLTGFANRFHRLLEASLNVPPGSIHPRSRRSSRCASANSSTPGATLLQTTPHGRTKTRGRIEQSALASTEDTARQEALDPAGFGSGAADTGGR